MTRKRWYLLMNSVVALWLLACAVIVLVHRFVPSADWLMVHVLLLGAVSTAILVWSQHFADSLLRRQAWGGRVFHGIRLIGHTVGAVVVVTGILSLHWGLVLAGAVLVAITAIAHAVSLIVQSRGALPARFGPLVRYYIAAGLFLVVGVAIGVTMAQAAVPALVHDRLYPAHLAFNLLGWVGLTVVGTVILLWPTVLHTRVSDAVGAIANRALWLCVGGLVLLGTASLFDLRQLFAVGLLIYLVGVAFIVVEGVKQARHAAQWTFASWSIAAAMAWFIYCIVAFGIVVHFAPSWEAATTGLGWLVGPIAAGFAAQVLLGALSYLLPVVLGGGPEVSRRTARELNRGALYRVATVNLGIVLYLLPAPSFVKVAVSMLVFGVLFVFLILALRAVLASRATAAPIVEPAPVSTRRGGALSAAVATVVMALTIGVALDPIAAGLNLGQSQSAVVATGHTTIVEMSMKNMRFVPDLVEVPAGDELIIRLTNEDDQVHDLVLANGASSSIVNPGQTVDVEVGVVGSSLEGWCSIAGHRLLGMVMNVAVIGEAIPSAAPTFESGHDHGASAGVSAASDIDLMREPESNFEARDAQLAPAPSASTHKYTFVATDELTEVAPGITQTLWTYNGGAPGPTLRGSVGDRFEITLVNDGTMGHSIDFHAGSLAPNLPMRTIQPGEQLTYVFTAERSGIWLYHCSTMPMSLHIANGMFGAVIIDPPELEPVAQEFLFVQSEFYLGAQGEIADPTRIATHNADLVAFNGYAKQYVYRPIEAKVGERVRIWVMDAGPNLSSAFHVVGAQFDTVYFEGDYQLKNGGSTGTGGSQVLGLMPAQGGFVELVFTEAGDYPFVTHVMSDAEKGATGIFHVTN